MNVSLTPEQQAFIEKHLENGRYHTAAEVVREGIRLLMDRELFKQHELEILREEICKGIEEADRGELLDGEQVFAELKERLRNGSLKPSGRA